MDSSNYTNLLSVKSNAATSERPLQVKVVELNEDDIPGTHLSEPFESHNVQALKWWLLCRGIRAPLTCKFDKQVALCALEVLRFLRDTNLAPNVLSGPFAGLPFLKCLLHTRVKGLTLASSSPNSSIQSRFLLRSVRKWWKDALGSLALGLLKQYNDRQASQQYYTVYH